MFHRFLEIAYEAELSTEEHPELMALAPKVCNEHPDTRVAAIQELRDMIYERGECQPWRLDDAFLLRFLRARRFVVPRAHRQLVRYCQFLEKYPALYKDVDLWGLARLGAALESNMVDHPHVGRLIIFRVGKWNPGEVSGTDMVRTAMAVIEIGLRAPKLQVMGITCIVDMEGVTIKQVALLTPTIAYQVACLMGLAEPLKVKACHIINYHWLLNTVLFISRRFIDKKVLSSLYIHGHDVKSLHQYIDPEYLPEKYGGTCRNHISATTWLNKIKKYRDEVFDKEMKDIGYAIKN